MPTIPPHARRFVLYNDEVHGVSVTWAELAEANDSDTMDAIGALEDGERAVFGMGEEVVRVDPCAEVGPDACAPVLRTGSFNGWAQPVVICNPWPERIIGPFYSRRVQEVRLSHLTLGGCGAGPV